MPELNLNKLIKVMLIQMKIYSYLDKVSYKIINKLNKVLNHVIVILRNLYHWKGILNRLKFQLLTYDKRNNVVLKDLNNYCKELK